jgi:hypothetical protein
MLISRLWHRSSCPYHGIYSGAGISDRGGSLGENLCIYLSPISFFKERGLARSIAALLLSVSAIILPLLNSTAKKTRLHRLLSCRQHQFL